jgi:hypothetical protein
LWPILLPTAIDLTDSTLVLICLYAIEFGFIGFPDRFPSSDQSGSIPDLLQLTMIDLTPTSFYLCF